jgi:T-complex protein 1 subunit zeta
MSAIQQLNPEATIVRQQNALLMNIGAARGLQSILKTNLGPKGTMKMLVSGSGDVKLTKDGNVLLHEMQIQHPTASLIARAATAQDDITGDGTTSNVLLVAEILKEAQRWVGEGLHPRAIAEGLTVARAQLHAALQECKREVDTHDKELLYSVCRTSLLTKLRPDLAEKLSQLVVDAVLTIRRDEEPVDLFMVEMMLMQHKTDLDTRLVAGLVLDHGCRHPSMPKRAENAFILTCNVSLEYEKRFVCRFLSLSLLSPPLALCLFSGHLYLLSY